MTKTQKGHYAHPDMLRGIILKLIGQKFKLDCGHHVTFGYFLGNDIIIRNGKNIKIICTLCD